MNYFRSPATSLVHAIFVECLLWTSIAGICGEKDFVRKAVAAPAGSRENANSGGGVTRSDLKGHAFNVSISDLPIVTLGFMVSRFREFGRRGPAPKGLPWANSRSPVLEI